MPRAVRLAAVVLLLLFVGVPFALPSAAALEVAKPRWTVGDEWSYAVTVTVGGAPVDSGDRRVVVLSRGPFEYQGVTRDAVVLATYENMSGGSPYAFEDVYDATTHELLATRSNGETLTAASPCTRLQYPIAYPGTWTASCDLGHGAFETTYIVAGSETITVPAGSYQTLSVDVIGHDAVRHWYADAACGKVAELALLNDQATYVNLTSVKCAAPPTSGTPTGSTPATGTPSATPTATPATRPPTGTPALTPSTSPTPSATSTLPFPRFTTRDNWHYESTATFAGSSVRVNTTVSAAAGGASVDLNGNVNVTDANGATVVAYMTALGLDGNGAVRREQVSPYVGVELFRAAGVPIGERRYDAPCPFVKWPITPGTEWSFSCRGVVVNKTPGGQDAPFTVTGNARAEATRQVTTPAGTFTGFPVRMSYAYSDGFSRTETRVYAADPCGYVQMTPGALGGVDELVGFYCASTEKGELVPEEISDRPTPMPAVGAVVAVALVVALAARRRSPPGT